MALTGTQMEIIRETVRNHGALALAAHNAGLTYSRLKVILSRDTEFAIEIDDAMAEHRDMILLMAQERATKSDTVLIKLLEASRPEFTPDGRKAALDTNKKVSNLRLRTFDEEGQEVKADGDDADAAATIIKPLQLGLKQGL